MEWGGKHKKARFSPVVMVTGATPPCKGVIYIYRDPPAHCCFHHPLLKTFEETQQSAFLSRNLCFNQTNNVPLIKECHCLAEKMCAREELQRMRTTMGDGGGARSTALAMLQAKGTLNGLHTLLLKKENKTSENKSTHTWRTCSSCPDESTGRPNLFQPV